MLFDLRFTLLAKKSTKSDGVSIYYFLFTIDYYYRIFQPNAMVAPDKKRKFQKIFYSLSGKKLRQKVCLQFCIFSHQTRR